MKMKEEKVTDRDAFCHHVFIIGCPLCLLQALSSMGCITINKSNIYLRKNKISSNHL